MHLTSPVPACRIGQKLAMCLAHQSSADRYCSMPEAASTCQKLQPPALASTSAFEWRALQGVDFSCHADDEVINTFLVVRQLAGNAWAGEGGV